MPTHGFALGLIAVGVLPAIYAFFIAAACLFCPVMRRDLMGGMITGLSQVIAGTPDDDADAKPQYRLDAGEVLFLSIVAALPFVVLATGVRREIFLHFMVGVSAAGVATGLAAASVAVWRQRKAGACKMIRAGALAFAGGMWATYFSAAGFIAMASD